MEIASANCMIIHHKSFLITIKKSIYNNIRSTKWMVLNNFLFLYKNKLTYGEEHNNLKKINGILKFNFKVY